MKAVIFLGLFAAAIGNAMADGDECSESVLAAITGTEEYTECHHATGLAYSSEELTTELTADMLTAICATPACLTVVEDITALGIDECELNEVHLMKDIAEPILAACGNSSSTGGSSSGMDAVETISDDDDDHDASDDTTGSGEHAHGSSTNSSTSTDKMTGSSTGNSTSSGSSSNSAAPVAVNLVASALALTGLASLLI